MTMRCLRHVPNEIRSSHWGFFLGEFPLVWYDFKGSSFGKNFHQIEANDPQAIRQHSLENKQLASLQSTALLHPLQAHVASSIFATANTVAGGLHAPSLLRNSQGAAGRVRAGCRWCGEQESGCSYIATQLKKSPNLSTVVASRCYQLGVWAGHEKARKKCTRNFDTTTSQHQRWTIFARDPITFVLLWAGIGDCIARVMKAGNGERVEWRATCMGRHWGAGPSLSRP